MSGLTLALRKKKKKRERALCFMPWVKGVLDLRSGRVMNGCRDYWKAEKVREAWLSIE